MPKSPPLNNGVCDVGKLHAGKLREVRCEKLAVVLFGGFTKPFSCLGVGLGVDVFGAEIPKCHGAGDGGVPVSLFDCRLFVAQPPSGVRFATEGVGSVVALSVGADVGGVVFA